MQQGVAEAEDVKDIEKYPGPTGLLRLYRSIPGDRPASIRPYLRNVGPFFHLIADSLGWKTISLRCTKTEVVRQPRRIVDFCGCQRQVLAGLGDRGIPCS